MDAIDQLLLDWYEWNLGWDPFPAIRAMPGSTASRAAGNGWTSMT